MTKPRAHLVLAMAVPGAPQVIGRRWRAALLVGVPFLASIAVAVSALTGDSLVGTALDPAVLRRLAAAVGVAALCAAASVLEAARHAARPISEGSATSGGGERRSRVASAMVAVVPLAIGGVGVAYATHSASTVDRVFQGGATRALPSRGGEGNTGKLSGFANPPSKKAAAANANQQDGSGDGDSQTNDAGDGNNEAAPDLSASDGRWNLLFLGGDAGKGRFNLRTDSMILVSIDRSTGDAAMVSVPRNLARLPLPAGPLRKANPRGWPDLANSLYEYVSTHPNAGDGTPQAPEHAVKGAIAEALGVPIDNYVLVDMGGFINVIDALGGVTLNIATAVPAPGNPSEAKHPVRAWFGPGKVHLDGTDALAYSRSRENDSDYRRMARQRCLLATAAHQLSPSELIRNYDKLLDAVDHSIRSDLSPKQARTLVDLFAKVHTSEIRSLGLTPPLVNTGAPDYAAIRRLVSETLSPARTAAANEAPASTSAGVVTSVPASTGSSVHADARPTATSGPADVIDGEPAC